MITWFSSSSMVSIASSDVVMGRNVFEYCETVDLLAAKEGKKKEVYDVRDVHSFLYRPSIRVEHIPSFVLSLYLFSFLSVRRYNAVSLDSHLALDKTQAIQNEACVYYVCHVYYVMSVHHVIEPFILNQRCSFSMP